MTPISQAEIDKITAAVESEFPNDPALQQVHIARKIIATEAKQRGMGLIEYVRSFRKESADQSR